MSLKRVGFLLYGLVAYLGFLGVFVYAAGFVGNILVPKAIDTGVPPPLGIALAVNLTLLGVFGLQHSVMARPSFKRVWTRIVPKPIERSTYVHASNLCMIALFVFWQPMPAIVWDVQHPVARGAVWGLFAAGWLLVPAVTVLIHHFDLFGLRQVWLYMKRRSYKPVGFVMPSLYRHVRHPLYVGWISAFWITPTMSAGHLLFAIGTTAYILVAIFFEERNLLEEHGTRYAEWRSRTPMLVPRLVRQIGPQLGPIAVEAPKPHEEYTTAGAP